MFFSNPNKRFINHIKKSTKQVFKETGENSIPFCVLLFIYWSTHYAKKHKQIASFVEVYSYFISQGYLSVLEYFMSEILNKDGLSFTEQVLLEKKPNNDVKIKPKEFVVFFFCQLGATSFESYSDLKNTEDAINERFNFYTSTETPDQLKTDTFIFNLENSKNNIQIQKFETDLFKIASIGLTGSIDGKLKINAFKEVIDLIKKKMIIAFSEYYYNKEN